jgi:TolB-like protein
MRRGVQCCVVAAALVLCAYALGAFAAEVSAPGQGEGTVSAAQAPAYDPAKTKVAVMPFVNALGREGPEEKRSCEQATERLRAMFASRSFQVLEHKAVADALKKLAIDLGDSEERTKETFQKIGEELGAELIVCAVLLDYGARQGRSRRAGEAKIELKAYDTRDRAYRVRTTQAGTKPQKRSFMGSFIKSADLRWGALEDAIDKALNEFLKPYPVAKKGEPAAAGSGSQVQEMPRS